MTAQLRTREESPDELLQRLDDTRVRTGSHSPDQQPVAACVERVERRLGPTTRGADA